MASTKQIVIVGGSFAGLPVAHGLLKDVLPAVASTNKQTYKVTLISSSDKFWWKIGAPRVIVNPKALPIEKALLPIAENFKKYSSEQFEFVHTFVESIDPSTKTLRLKNDSSMRYDSLVIASGTSFASALWTVADGEQPLIDALKLYHASIPKAQSILIAGGGPAGVETAGEFGETYGGKKEITLLSGSTRLLSRLHNKGVGADAQSRLTKMGIRVINDNVRVTSSRREGDKEVLQLSDGTTKTVDVYIEATGDKPNSKFVPSAWLNDNNYVKTDGQTLRLDVPGVRDVYCVGTVASYSNGSIMDATFSTSAILHSIKLDLQGTG